MTPTRARSVASWALLLPGLLIGSACGWTPPDEQVLERFFTLSKLHDTTRLAEVATVVFDPTIEGVVERFDVASREDTPAAAGIVRRDVRLRARVRSPAGRPAERILRVTLEGPSEKAFKVTQYSWDPES